MRSFFCVPLDPHSPCLSLVLMMENCHVDTSLLLSPSLLCISSRWKLHLLQSSLWLKAVDGAFVLGKKKGPRCSFHSWDNYSYCDLNDSHCSPLHFIHVPGPQWSPESGNMKNPYNETILADGKRLLKLHLLQRRLNYMSNCDNFPSIQSSFWKVKKQRCWKGNYLDNIECEMATTKKGDCKKV